MSLSVPKPVRFRRTGRDRRQSHGDRGVHNAGTQPLARPRASADNGVELGTRSLGGRALLKRDDAVDASSGHERRHTRRMSRARGCLNPYVQASSAKMRCTRDLCALCDICAAFREYPKPRCEELLTARSPWRPMRLCDNVQKPLARNIRQRTR